MNFKQKAKQLEQYLEEEFKKQLPVVVLKDKSLAYKNYKIKENNLGTWILSYLKTGDFIASFRTKSCALLAAKFYDKNDFVKYNAIKLLDSQYWTNFVDTNLFKERIPQTKDLEKKDLFRARYNLTRARTEHYKEEISRMFKTHF